MSNGNRVRGAQEQITQAVTQWEGVSTAPHRFGGVEYQLGSREIGHIHGDTLVDIPFPTAVRHELVAAGLAQPHHLLHDSGWISFYIQQPQDVASAISLLERSYRIAHQQLARRNKRGSAEDRASATPV